MPTPGPERDQPEGIGLGRLADEPVERKRRDEQQPRRGTDAGDEARPRRADRRPRGEAAEEQRGQEEEVPVLHPVGGESRRERPDDERRPERDGQRGGEVLLHARAERPRPDGEDDERHDRDDRDVQRQLLHVPQPEPQDAPHVVAALAHHAVGAEQVGERAAAHRLEDEERDEGSAEDA